LSYLYPFDDPKSDPARELGQSIIHIIIETVTMAKLVTLNKDRQSILWTIKLPRAKLDTNRMDGIV